jgi:catechol-2,3-dioxygenase
MWSAAFFAAHNMFSADGSAVAAAKASGGEPRIRRLELLSAAPTATMQEFYHQRLGLPVLEASNERLTIAAGQTTLTFHSQPEATPRPFYHFAFNIPENKVRAAWAWQKERSPLLPIPPRLRDSRFPDDVVNYAHWNAHSIFFFDPAGNVVEYIARHDLPNAVDGDFTSNDILYASEIAFVTDDVSALSGRIQEIAGIEPYRGGNEDFMALGDEHGLLLVMRRGRVISFDSPEKKAVDVFQTRVNVRSGKQGQHSLDGFPYQLQVTSG